MHLYDTFFPVTATENLYEEDKQMPLDYEKQAIELSSTWDGSKNRQMLPGYQEVVGKLSSELDAIVADIEEMEKNEGVRKIEEYVKEAFPDIDTEAIPLFPDYVEQLSWLLENTVYTSESSAKLASNDDWRLIEPKRAISRLYTALLLNKGDAEAYKKFVQEQPEEDKLNPDSFKRLDYIKRLSSTAREAVYASGFFVKSKIADDLAKDAGIQASVDSEIFLTDTITQRPNIYPIYRKLSTEAKNFLSIAFLRDTHLRQMLSAEGGRNMFKVLRELIKSGEITREEYEVWFARWIVNIGGFRGHVNEKGSIYLTQKVANTIFALKESLDKLWENADYDVFSDYLQKRADWLGLGGDNLYLAHIAALADLHTKEEGIELQNWFNTFSLKKQNELKEGFEQFCDCKVTPTYTPGVITTLKDLGCNISERLDIFVQITEAASAAYREAVANEEKERIVADEEKAIENKETLFSSIPLCYREVARKDNLIPIIKQYRDSHGSIDQEVKVDKDGLVSCSNRYEPALRVSLCSIL